MRGKASRAWLFAAVLACLMAGTDAIVSSVSQRIYARGGDARRFDRFGFKAGGTAQFTTTFTEANNNNYDEAPLDVYIIGCPDTVMTDFELKAGGTSFCVSQFAYSNSTVRGHCAIRPFEITQITKTTVIEVIRFAECDKWFRVKISLTTVDESKGVEKEANQYILVSAADVRDAYDKASGHMNAVKVGYIIPSVVYQKIAEVFPLEEWTPVTEPVLAE